MIMTTWRSSSSRVCALLTDTDAPQQQFCSLIQELNDFTYPVDGLTASEVHDFVCDVTRPSAVHSPQSVAKMAQLCFSLLSTQLSSSPKHVDDQLFNFFSGWLEAAVPATELLYLLAMLKPSYDIPQAVCQCVADMSVGESFHVDVQRAALHYLSVLSVRGSKASKQLTASLETIGAQLLESTQQQLASVAMAKLVSSQLRAVSSLVKIAGETFLQPLLPSLLAGLKFYMTTGLPGQPVCTAPLPQLTIPTVPKPKKDRRFTSASHHRPHGQPPPQQLRPIKPPSAPSTSDSEVSDSELQDSVITKALSSRLRHQALVCLTSVFTAIGPRTTFSYWLSFLPDGPRLPNAPPSILSCILRDPNHKCRSAALNVLCAMLEGTRPYLAAADDHLQSCGLAFTPFSSQLGGILSELHHCLILSLGTEAQPVVLTRAVRCLATLANTTPYHQLRSGYASRILSALHPLSQYKDIDVRVACLTCGGAVLSTFPALPEVMEWLSAPQLPWLLAWCSSLLLPAALPSAAALLTGSLQVLTAATKFYFSSMIGHWEMVVKQCLVHLTTPQQQHSLKLLEELCRASAELPQAVQLWSLVLEGPLTAILQNPTSPSLCSQACAVLATLSSTVMEQLQPSLRVLALTLPLGLSRDNDASPSVSSSSVRVLGVYCTLSCLREDGAFLQDSGAAILHALTSNSQTVRVQASWALGNLTDALASLTAQDSSNLLSFPLLLGAAKSALRDKDMVKCNGVRAIGNLLKPLSGLDDKEVLSVCSELAQCISSGTMKLRWNACYACHSIFSSSSFPATYHAATDLLLDALCEAACTCPNFKVCTHASLALGSLPTYTAKQWSCVWSSTMTCLERSLEHDDFTEYRQAANLRTQLCRTLCHMLCTGADLTVVPLQRLSDPAMSCLSACLNSASKEDRPMVEAAERKLSSSPAAVQANPTLMELLVTFQTVLNPSQ